MVQVPLNKPAYIRPVIEKDHGDRSCKITLLREEGMYDIFLTSQSLCLDLNNELYNQEGSVLGINPFSQHCFPKPQNAKDCWQKTISHHI